MVKIVIVQLAMFVVITAARLVVQERDFILDPSQGTCNIGVPCQEDPDCSCEDDTVICNHEQKCKERTFWDFVMRQKPCFRLFKHRCETNADCPCNEGVGLRCEDNECVENRLRSKLTARRHRFSS